MKQKKIAYWLKGLTILLGIFGILFFAALTWYAFYMKNENPDNPLWMFIFFSWYTAVCCYIILVKFWRVCTEIGRDHSFSKENATSFHHMTICAAMLGIGFLLRLLLVIGIGQIQLWIVLFRVIEIFFSIFLAFLCEALSQLVLYAYEVKKENELTI